MLVCLMRVNANMIDQKTFEIPTSRNPTSQLSVSTPINQTNYMYTYLLPKRCIMQSGSI